MKNSFFCFIFAIITSVATFAQQPLIASAPPLVMTNPLTPDEAGSIGRTYDKLLSEAKSLRIINKLILDKGMRDYGFQQRDWADAEKTVALGDALNIEWVIRPQMFKRTLRNSQNGIMVTAALLNIETQKIIHTTPVLLGNANEAQNKLKNLIDEITQIITGGSGGLAQSDQSVYKVGDRGPAGGWVFYDKGRYSEGWRYLEVAPPETGTSVARGRYAEKIPGTASAIGSGKKNTELILQSKENYQIIKAAQYCAGLRLNWFDDWFLPSQRELSQLNSIPSPKSGGPDLGGFSAGYYWSSSGSDDSVNFYTAGDAIPDRNQPSYFVRAVRAF